MKNTIREGTDYLVEKIKEAYGHSLSFASFSEYGEMERFHASSTSCGDNLIQTKRVESRYTTFKRDFAEIKVYEKFTDNHKVDLLERKKAIKKGDFPEFWGKPDEEMDAKIDTAKITFYEECETYPQALLTINIEEDFKANMTYEIKKDINPAAFLSYFSILKQEHKIYEVSDLRELETSIQKYMKNFVLRSGFSGCPVSCLHFIATEIVHGRMMRKE